jgi:DNA polymerase (family 10)
MSNAEIADLLLSLAQMLAAQKENPFKIKAYRRAAKTISNLSESVDELVRDDADLTQYAGIGAAIAGAIREIVQQGGTLQQLETLRANARPEVAAVSAYPRLDPQRVARIYKKLGIGSISELLERLERGEIGQQLGARMEQHVRQGLTRTTHVLLYDAHRIATAVEEFLLSKCGVTRADAAGDYRRRVEVIGELSFVIATDDFQSVVAKFRRYGGRTTVVAADEATALFQLPSGVHVRLNNAPLKQWGIFLLVATGSQDHLQKLASTGHELAALTKENGRYESEDAVYRGLGLDVIPPELREGNDEVDRAASGRLPHLITIDDICGELHAHSTSSDGAQTIEQMAGVARQKGYEYLGITDHSQSLRIARGVSESDLWAQIRYIDQLNKRATTEIQILKSAEVDILADGSLDYPDELLKELDYTVCSIHSKFALDKAAQTERVMRAMDNRYFNILGHATGRLLLRRPGYELDLERLINHAKSNGCFFEINGNPNRLDFSAENARLAWAAGVKIAITTDAHSTREFDFISCGLEQARRAGLANESILNCYPWSKLQRILRR